MIAQRMRGLITLHLTVVTVCTALLFKAYAVVYNHLPHVLPLSPDVPYFGFLLCIVGGMIYGSRYLRSLASRFHRVTWVDAAHLATRQVVVVAVVVFAFIFAFKEVGLSRLFLGSYFTLCWAMLVLLNQGLPRLLSSLLFERSRKLPTLFVGNPGSLSRLQNWLASKEVLGLQPVGFLTDDENPGSGTTPPFLGREDRLEALIEERHVAQVILLEIPQTQADGNRIIDTCERLGCRLLIYSNLGNLFRHPLVTVTEEGHQFYSLQEEPLEDPLNRMLKRGFDLVLALPVVVLLLPPLIVLVWLMQRLQAPGPLFHIQERTGYGHRRFRMLKFRSMYAAGRDAAAEARQASKGDARIYPFGRFLRRTSLDEIPQFWNVLVGNMSAVGPRPHLIVHDQLFATQMNAYRTRFFVKPGITGLAQCNGFRGEITENELLQRRIEFDLAYITQWSIWLDLQITVKTIKQVLFPPKTAY